MQNIAKALQRRPEFGLSEDAPAVAHCQAGAQVVASHSNGMQHSFWDDPAPLRSFGCDTGHWCRG